MSLSVDREQFYRRIKRFYAGWNKERTKLSDVDAIIIAVGRNEEDQYSKSVTTQLWLLGYEMTDTVIGFTKEKMVVITSKTKAEFLKPIVNGAKDSENADGTPEVSVLIRSKEDNGENFKQFYDVVIGGNMGVFTKDSFAGNFYSQYKKDFKVRGKNTVDIAADVGIILAAKEEQEVNAMRKASRLTTEIFKEVYKSNLMETIDMDKKIKHSKMASLIEESLKDQRKLLGIDPIHVEPCFTPIIQSGGNYSLKYSAQSDKEYIHFGTIVCYLGVRYKNYCSNMARTMFVNPTDAQKEVYTTVSDCFDSIMDKFVPGAKLSSLYEETKLFLQKSKHPELAAKLGKNIGFGMGIDFRESSLVISPKCDEVIRKGMVFNLNLAFAELKNNEAKEEKGKSYAITIAETILVNDGDSPTNLTGSNKRKVKNVSIYIKDASDDEESDDNDVINQEASKGMGRGMRATSSTASKRDHDSSESRRKNHQEKLHDQLNQEAKERILENKKGSTEEKRKKTNTSYKNSSLFPMEREIKDGKIFIDKKYETVIIPFFGMATPFHISTLKNCSSSLEGDYTYLRLNFFVPGSTISAVKSTTDGPYPDSAIDGSFMKEVTFRAPGQTGAASNLNNVFRGLKELQKRFRAREAEARERAGIVQQDKLVLNQNRGAPKLKDLYMRPSISQKRMQGYLEAHTNGFRYTAQRGDKVDILYLNIKHSIFQPCDKEMIMVLHFHLKNGIMIGKKRHVDVQFYIEVGEITTDINRTSNLRDRDDLYAEQQEREQRHRLKTAFKNFMEKVTHLTRDIDFDVPFRDLGFSGVPHRSTCLLQPTSSALCNVTEWPAFIVSLDDVDFVHFERVSFSLKNFDCVVIYKDYAKKVSAITSIPMTSLDPIKEWLNSSDIRYTEGVQSLNWAKVLKTVMDDPEGFFSQGGWDFLKADDSGSESDDGDEEDQNFSAHLQNSDGDDDDDDGGSSSDSYDSETESDSESSQSLGTSEEEGLDWDELEKMAAKEDNTNNYEEVENNKGDRHKRKGDPYGKPSKKQRRR